MTRCSMLLCLLFSWTAIGMADVPPSHDLTATATPVRQSMVGRWQRVDTAYEHEVLVIGRGGQVTLDEAGGRWALWSSDTVQLDFQNLSGFNRRLKCRWRLADAMLTLEIVESMSQASIGAEYHVLDIDRTVQGETWRFRRVRR
jgi:hypothetical protein